MHTQGRARIWTPNDQPHPTVPGAIVCMVEQIVGKRREYRRHREAIMRFGDGGWITVQGHPNSGQLGIASYYNGPERVETLNALIAEMTAWLETERQQRTAA